MRKNFEISAAMIVGLQAHGLPIPEIARRIRVSRCHGYRLAAGEVRRPSYETFQRIERLHAQVIKAARPK
jgi:hypothetical protein